MTGEPALACDALARLVSYPGPTLHADLAACGASLGGSTDDQEREAAEALARFGAHIATRSTTEVEEVYTWAFDFDPKCTLEIGWHLFGEEYARGALLVRLRELLRQHDIPETAELPDHLVHVLPVLARLEPEQASALATACVLPALEKIVAGLAATGNPYEHLVQAIRVLLDWRYGTPADTVGRTGGGTEP
ncbi:MAG: nitrate reductase molybdenum cofactor assembly chaperone [Candidatus Latescibacterota bacterium]